MFRLLQFECVEFLQDEVCWQAECVMVSTDFVCFLCFLCYCPAALAYN